MNEGYYFFGIIFLCIGIFVVWKIEPPKTAEETDSAQLHLLRTLIGFTFMVIGAGMIIYRYIMSLKLPP